MSPDLDSSLCSKSCGMRCDSLPFRSGSRISQLLPVFLLFSPKLRPARFRRLRNPRPRGEFLTSPKAGTLPKNRPSVVRRISHSFNMLVCSDLRLGPAEDTSFFVIIPPIVREPFVRKIPLCRQDNQRAQQHHTYYRQCTHSHIFRIVDLQRNKPPLQ